MVQAWVQYCGQAAFTSTDPDDIHKYLTGTYHRTRDEGADGAPVTVWDAVAEEYVVATVLWYHSWNSIYSFTESRYHYESQNDYDVDGWVGTARRYYTWKVEIATTNRLTGYRTVSQTKVYLSDWIHYGAPIWSGGFGTEEYPSPYYTYGGGVDLSTDTETETLAEYTLTLETERITGVGQTEQGDSITAQFSDTVSDRYTYTLVLSDLDDLLDGPWTDEHNEQSGIDWDNQIYFDASVAHSRYYLAYYNHSGTKCIEDLEDSYVDLPDEFDADATKEHLWVGYQIAFLPYYWGASSGWAPSIYPSSGNWTGDLNSWNDFPACTKTRAKISVVESPVSVMLNESQDIGFYFDDENVDPLTVHVPYCDLDPVVPIVYDGMYVADGDETVVDPEYYVCDEPFTINAPTLSGRQRWHHIYF